MAKVIPSDSLVSHNIDKYNFKVFGSTSSSNDSKFVKSVFDKTVETKTVEPIIKNNESVDSSSISQNSKDSLIESLLKKTDEMSSNFIKLQMRLEEKEEEFKLELKKASDEAFAKGVEAGIAQSANDVKANYDSGINQFSVSVTKLEASAKEFENALEGIKNELITAALDISKEVINIEVSTNSTKIAKVLSSELIKELQSASKIILKVNPKDHGLISEKVGSLEHVEVVSDSAVSAGGVIAISDAGNIDAQISKRFERVKRAALSE